MRPEDVDRLVTALLVDKSLDDDALLAKLTELSSSVYFSCFTWRFGPRLYGRNRVKFRGLIMRCFGYHRVRRGLLGVDFPLVKWDSTEGKDLELWFQAADKLDDVQLMRQLLIWRVHSMGWTAGRAYLLEQVVTRLKAAPNATARAVVLAKFDLWMLELDEASAVRIYRAGQDQTRDFIMRHTRFLRPGVVLVGEERVLWRHLQERAAELKDWVLSDAIYRRQAPIPKWERDALDIARKVRDSEELIERLTQTEPAGIGIDTRPGLYKLLQARGKEVLPFVVRSIQRTNRVWQSRHLAPFLEIAKKNKWWELLAVAVRVSGLEREFNSEIEWVLSDSALSPKDRTVLLWMLAGHGMAHVAGGHGLGRVLPLSDQAAVALYKAYPDLLRGPYRQHLIYNSVGVQRGYGTLISEAGSKSDWQVLDQLTSQLLRVHFESDIHQPNQKAREDLGRVTTFFQGLVQKDPKAFAIRAAASLSRLAGPVDFDARKQVRQNALARLFFNCPLAGFLEAGDQFKDMIESDDPQVQRLAFEVLRLDDPRARRFALDCADALLRVLLASVDRPVRQAGIDALKQVVEQDMEWADMIISRAREALDAPDRDYPDTWLLSLIAHATNRWPQLQPEAEQPTVYGRELAGGVR